MSFTTPPNWIYSSNPYGGYIGYFYPTSRIDNLCPPPLQLGTIPSPATIFNMDPRGYASSYSRPSAGETNVEANYVDKKANTEEMSDGIRALLEITRNFKNQSKFEGVPFVRSRDSVTGDFNLWGSQSRQQQQAIPMITQASAPPPSPVHQPAPHVAMHNSAASNDHHNNSNYAMAVKKRLEPCRGPVVYRRHSPFPPPPRMPAPLFQHAAADEPKTWIDKNGRKTVNAKEMEGGPKINGRSIVNGINLSTLKFVKPSRQCPQWEDSKHRINEPNCPLWHPRERCQYYPRCRLTAEVCGFGHPFCGTNVCQCAPEKRSLQLNHLPHKEEAARKKTQNG